MIVRRLPTPTRAKEQPTSTHNLALYGWITWIGVAATWIFLAAFLFYWMHFGANQLSQNPSDWGLFGDFIGGVTNPLLSLFALLSLLLTLNVQSKQLIVAREQLDHQQQSAREQLAQLRLQGKKDDLYRVLQVLEARLERLYREPLYIPNNAQLEQWELYLLFSHATPLALERVPALSDMGPAQHRNEYLSTKASLTQLHITLVKLSSQLTTLAYLDPHDEIIVFYEPTINYFAEKLVAIGYLPDPDAATIEIHRSLRDSLRRAQPKES